MIKDQKKLVIVLAGLVVLVIAGYYLLSVKNQPVTKSPVADTTVNTDKNSASESIVTQTDLSSGYWLTPHAATRSIAFLENYQFKFNEGDSEKTVYAGSFAINGSTVTLKFNDYNKKDIVLKFSKDQYSQYLTDDQQGEYFVYTDSNPEQ